MLSNVLMQVWDRSGHQIVTESVGTWWIDAGMASRCCDLMSASSKCLYVRYTTGLRLPRLHCRHLQHRTTRPGHDRHRRPTKTLRKSTNLWRPTVTASSTIWRCSDALQHRDVMQWIVFKSWVKRTVFELSRMVRYTSRTATGCSTTDRIVW